MANFSAMLAIETIQERYGHHMAVLIEACRVHFGTSTLASLNTLLERPETNYAEIALHSRLHRIRPVIFRILLQANCPDDFKARIKTELHSITLNNFSIAKETERIIQELALLGVTAIPYKGVAFSKQFYGDISMRESSDIDLIIDAADLEKTFPFFEGDGYKAQGLEGFKRMNKELFYQQQKDFCFDKKLTNETGFHVELHWKILHPNFCAPPTLENFEKVATQKLSLLDAPRVFLNDEEHLRAVLLHHWIHDVLEYLKTFIDIAQGLKHISLGNRYNFITEENSFYGLTVASYCTEELFGISSKSATATNKTAIKIGKRLLDFNLHSSVGRLKPGVTRNLIRNYWMSYKNRLPFISNPIHKLRFSFKFWMGLILPKQGDIDIVGLPKGFAFLYIFIRPARILLRKKSDA